MQRPHRRHDSPDTLPGRIALPGAAVPARPDATKSVVEVGDQSVLAPVQGQREPQVSHIVQVVRDHGPGEYADGHKVAKV